MIDKCDQRNYFVQMVAVSREEQPMHILRLQPIIFLLGLLVVPGVPASESDVVVVEYEREFEQLIDDDWQPRRHHQITLFEITDKKITRVRDYW